MPRDLLLFDAGQVAEARTNDRGAVTTPGTWRDSSRHAGMAGERGAGGDGAEWLDVESLEEALTDPRLRGDVFSLPRRAGLPATDRGGAASFCAPAAWTTSRTSSPSGSRASAPPPATRTSSPATTCSPSTQVARARTATTTSCVTSSDSGSARTRASPPSARCSGDGGRARGRGDRPGAIELLLGANELDLALGVIARGGEAELERRPSEQLRIWASRLSPADDGGDPWV